MVCHRTRIAIVRQSSAAHARGCGRRWWRLYGAFRGITLGKIRRTSHRDRARIHWLGCEFAQRWHGTDRTQTWGGRNVDQLWLASHGSFGTRRSRRWNASQHWSKKNKLIVTLHGADILMPRSSLRTWSTSKHRTSSWKKNLITPRVSSAKQTYTPNWRRTIITAAYPVRLDGNAVRQLWQWPRPQRRHRRGRLEVPPEGGEAHQHHAAGAEGRRQVRLRRPVG